MLHIYRIVRYNYFRWVQIFVIFVDRPASAKIKTMKKLTKTEIDEVIICLHWSIWTSAQSVCALNGGCREESACYCTICQRTRKRRSEVVKPRSAVLNPALCSTSHSAVVVLILWRSPHKRRLDHCCTSLLLHFIVQCHFFGFHVGCRHQLQK